RQRAVRRLPAREAAEGQPDGGDRGRAGRLAQPARHPRVRHPGAGAHLRQRGQRAHRLARQRRAAQPAGDRRLGHPGLGALPGRHGRAPRARAAGAAGQGLPLHRHPERRDRHALVSAGPAQRLPRGAPGGRRVHPAGRPAQADPAGVPGAGEDAGRPGLRPRGVRARQARLPPDHHRLGGGDPGPCRRREAVRPRARRPTRRARPRKQDMQPIRPRLSLALLLAATLAGASACTDREAQRQAQLAAEAEARARAAAELQRQYEAAVADRNWELARVHGVALLDQYPDSEAAAAIGPGLEEVKARAEEAREQRRLASLWNYARVPAGKGEQRTAAILSQEPVDTGGSRPAAVQLVIRDHPEWKRSAYLVLEGGDFDCYGGCKVQVKFDDAAARPMSAWRPKTDEAIAMFIEDYRGLWKRMRQARRLEISFPVKAGGSRTAVFETGGL